VLWTRLRSFVRKDRLDRDFDDELATHLELLTDDARRRGLSDADARRQALLKLGRPESLREEHRDARGFPLVDALVQDSKYAIRILWKSPVFTGVVTLTLALGIGANTALFSLVDALALRKLPVARPEALVLLEVDATISHRQFLALRERFKGFAGLAAIWTIDRANVTVESARSDSAVGMTRIGLASADYFTTLGVDAPMGRTFTAHDEIGDGKPVALISHAFWQRTFARAEDVIGRTITINRVRYTVIGVTPNGFTGEWIGMPTDVWVPFAMASQVAPEYPGGPERFPRRVLARLSDARDLARVQAAVQVVYRQILMDEPGAADAEQRAAIARTTMSLVPAARGYSPQRDLFAQPLAILGVAVGLLLLVACANLANLLLARSGARQREIAIRLAIGASNGRIARQTLTESLVLAVGGTIVGTVFAVWAEGLLIAMTATAPVNMAGATSDAPGLYLDLGLDLRTLTFAALLGALTAMLFGAAPAWALARVPLVGALSSSARIVRGGRRFGPSAALVVAQVAVSLVLVLGAALLVRTLLNLRTTDLGMARERVLLVWTAPGQTGRQDTAVADLWQRVQERLAVLPAVIAASATNQSLLRGEDLPPGSPAVGIRVDGEPAKPNTTPGLRSFVQSGFFDALGSGMVAGRDFTEADNETAPRVVIINEAMARFYFGDDNPVGRILRFAGPTGTPFEIVGVARDFTKGTPRGGVHAEFATYFPYRDPEALNRGAQSRLRVMLIVLRTAGEPLALADRVRQELRAIDPALPILRINTVDQQVDDVLARDRLLAALSSFLGASALLLSSLGLFGLVSYQVARRTNEIGLRLALGATRGGVLRMILRDSGRLVALGLVCGLAAAVPLVRLIGSRLYGVTAADPSTAAVVTAVLALVAAGAVAAPARRAVRIDPVTALRGE